MIKFNRDKTFPDIEYCNVINSNHKFPKHFHEDVYTFSFMESGGSYWNDTLTDSIVKPGDIAMLNPGQIHSGIPINNDSSTYKILYINKSLLDDFLSSQSIDKDIEYEKTIYENKLNAHFFSGLFNSLSSNMTSMEKESNLIDYISYTINNTSCNISLNNNDVLSTKKNIKLLIEYLKSDLHIKLSLDDLSSVSGLSKFHLLRSFKKYTGLTPHVFRTQYKIEKAKKDILKGVALCDIAQEVGFSDQSHLTKTFKEYLGFTPKQFCCSK